MKWFPRATAAALYRTMSLCANGSLEPASVCIAAGQHRRDLSADVAGAGAARVRVELPHLIQEGVGNERQPALPSGLARIRHFYRGGGGVPDECEVICHGDALVVARSMPSVGSLDADQSVWIVDQNSPVFGGHVEAFRTGCGGFTIFRNSGLSRLPGRRPPGGRHHTTVKPSVTIG